MSLRNVIATLLLSVASLGSAATFASDYSGRTPSNSIVPSECGDVVTPDAPNAAGISFNRFDRFHVQDKPLSLLNRSNDGAIRPTTIVITSDSIPLPKLRQNLRAFL